MTNGIGRVGWRNFVSATPTTASIITTGLVLNLDASNPLSYSGTGTTWTDLSGNGNSGTLVNGTSYSSTSGGTLAFDGINDYVSLNSNSINSLTRFTFNIWFKTPSIAKEQVLFSTVNSTQTMGYHIEFYTSKILMQVFPSGGYTYASSVLSSNTWYNITVSYDNGNITYYNNGIQDGSVTRTFNVSTATTFIGKWGGGATYDLIFGGNIAHVSFYDRVLTSVEVAQNFNSTKERFGYPSYTAAPLTTTYPTSLKLFIDAGNPLSYAGTGTTVTDLVGTQNGTLVNGVGYSSANGGYFTFDGVNDYIDFGINSAIRTLDARTISMWVWVDPSVPYCWFFNDEDRAVTGYKGVEMWLDSGGYRSILNNNSSYQIVVNIPPSKGAWKYITTSWNGTSLKAYINGALNQSLTQTIIPTSNTVSSTKIGTKDEGFGFLKGNISQMKIYNTQLSDAEVLTDFNEFKTRYGY